MYDAVTPAAIPANAEVVAGYVDGLYRWPEAAWGRFPNAVTVRIAVLPGTNDGDFIDIEPGNGIPRDAPDWLRMRGPGHGVYCSLTDVTAVVAACGGLLTKLWVAHYTGRPHLCSTQCLRDNGWQGEIPDGLVVATQYADPDWGSGGNYDVSLCRADWP